MFVEFGYVTPPDWSSTPFIVTWLVEFLILFFLYRRYRIKKRASMGKVIVILVFTDPLYLIAGFTLIYVLVATSLWIASPQGQ